MMTPMNDRKIIETSNATELTEHCVPIGGTVKKRLKELFDFCSLEPLSITVVNSNSESTVYGAVLKMRIMDDASESFKSWSVFANDREKIEGIVVRKAIWDGTANKNQDLPVSSDIMVSNTFLDHAGIKRVEKALRKLDRFMTNGIPIRRIMGVKGVGREMEVFRAYDWGSRHTRWSSDTGWEDLEVEVLSAMDELDIAVEESSERIPCMKANYLMLPEEYIEIRHGGCQNDLSGEG